MKVALVCDWLTEIGGAEQVLKTFHEIFPDAPIYTSQYSHRVDSYFSSTGQGKALDVRTGWFGLLPAALRRYTAPLRQLYFKHLDLTEYDLVISVTGCDAKFVHTRPGAHLCYCHVPTQYYWGKSAEYLKDPGFGLLNPLARCVFGALLPYLRKKDLAAATRPDYYLTISTYAAREIRRYYKREANVICPPVNAELFRQVVENYHTKKGKCQIKKSEQKSYSDSTPVENSAEAVRFFRQYRGKYYINFSRQVTWKRLDLTIAACKKLGRPLVLIGDGPEHAHLIKLAKVKDSSSSASPTPILFLPALPQEQLLPWLAGARAFLFPSEEPFGIAPVESIAAGCPVIAYKSGGALDFIKDGQNGFFFAKQTAASLAGAIRRLESHRALSRRRVSKTAEPFSVASFKTKVKSYLKTSRSAKTSQEKLPPTQPKQPLRTRFRRLLLYLLIPSLFFSFYPLIYLGASASTNFELSPPLLVIAFLAALSLPSLPRAIRTLFRSPCGPLFLLLPTYISISVLWSSQPLRGFLTAGVLWCIIIIILTIQELITNKNTINKLVKIAMISTLLICVFCWAQCFLDLVSLDRSTTLLCAGCTYYNFGFPRPNGFSIEPQFMGNLLLASALFGFLALCRQKISRPRDIVATFFVFSTLFLTLSRGAIYAFAVAVAIVVIYRLIKHQKFFSALAVTISAFLFVLASQGLMAAASTTSDTFLTGVSKSISQLSLGRIELFPELRAEPDASASNEPKPAEPSEAIFSGYVADSTDTRLDLSSRALDIWNDSPTNIIFGVGLGSAGTALYDKFPELGPKNIVQNQYISILLETGLIGFAITAIVLYLIAKKAPKSLLPLLVAYAITLCFFSGLPNALHIYLVPALYFFAQPRIRRSGRHQKN